MGGLITLLYLADHPTSIPLRGAVVGSPLLELAIKVNVLTIWTARLAAIVAPTLAIKAKVPPGDICRDPEQVRLYTADPDRVGVVTARWFAAMNKACARAMEVIPRIELPMLWCFGTEDRLVSPTAVEAGFARLPNPKERDQTIVKYVGYFHELHNEPAPERRIVIDRAAAWMLERPLP